MIDRGKRFFTKYKALPSFPAVRNAGIDEMLVSDGDTVCFDAGGISEADLIRIADDYIELPQPESRQQRKEKSRDDLVGLLKAIPEKLSPANSVLLPRLIRSQGRVYATDKAMVVSTNFYVINMGSREEAIILATWFSTVFYQLICEANAKSQEGPRKMEVADFEATHIPIIEKLTKKDNEAVIEEATRTRFLKLNNPEIRGIDSVWAKILFGGEAETRLHEARQLLEFLANARNPEKTEPAES
jgi:hypothetical protein